ncbi:NupC/NupG family nucleoside CNT transporter [Shewanella fidelis]|uniref:Nucleoside permease n=1 Tax=Shewanella fidelis TaxID=173509 RepID=A0AAW8NQU6_9GAMM|nr:NupC/NupG family nucleoside CNT transporter [Shewanella fidelis]MDR8525463.1 NupC/NupG family nucleoside CNT transporter [Shewanella fidelis]MDW4813218.1 NupC/NupG family nucleoside CNT transporter [Shewanella fidelis]MDW4816902.1 NupC/NupG family nucleoside CNT transporter [Shewanella fidelis]MDW4820061.1 NupC/NupG family nucleoside CNT transporter [Shewanella fidelis]MDW4825683.1 NupC/NupG family nucleoside CNT transporter [Shewanella fidelis]
MQILISIVGIIAILAVAFLASENRKAINYRTVGMAFLLQLVMGAFVIYSSFGQAVIFNMAEAVSTVIGYSNQGMSFMFGGLVSDKMYELFGSGGFVLAFKVLPIIVFFSAISAVLYYLGIMQWVVRIVGGALQKILNTSKAESMSASANIFLGVTEAPLLIKPYMPKMTRAELFAVMCGGLASIAGTMLAGYAQLGIKMEYLLAASFMAAPGGLLFAKLLIPQTEKVEDESLAVIEENPPANIIDAATTGTMNGLSLAMAVGAMLFAFVSLVALMNGMLGGIGNWFGIDGLSLQMILGYVFAPIAWLMGVAWDEALLAGSFIGQKIVINEFFAYINLAPYLTGDMIVESTGLPMSERTQVILSFALCGFANLGTVAIAIAGIGGLVPERRSEIASLGLKALFAGILSNLMAATIAGLFMSFV